MSSVFSSARQGGASVPLGRKVIRVLDLVNRVSPNESTAVEAPEFDMVAAARREPNDSIHLSLVQPVVRERWPSCSSSTSSGADNQWTLTPLVSDSELNLSAGRAVRAEEVLTRLAVAAKTLRDDAPM